ncbi:hypothetical protein ALQ65_01266 [Pseudomonas syringae pv. coriandricola]|uniref:Uncharacterized protein n=1 Tax=Pseudomonas syringae pv. coriandricola TaxID=264453 RepID=A0A3M3JI43_9PSED|nr:hypothetical protein ALQ65_01266 [Pseudomonas syringae pv. coriandricola]
MAMQGTRKKMRKPSAIGSTLKSVCIPSTTATSMTSAAGINDHVYEVTRFCPEGLASGGYDGCDGLRSGPKNPPPRLMNCKVRQQEKNIPQA